MTRIFFQTRAGNALLKLYIDILHEYNLEFILQSNVQYMTPLYLTQIGYFEKLRVNVVIFDKSTRNEILFQPEINVEEFMTIFMIGFKFGDLDFQTNFNIGQPENIYQSLKSKSFYDTILNNGELNNVDDYQLLHLGLIYKVCIFVKVVYGLI